MKLVSVIIPSFNRAHTLGRAIDSVLSQDFNDYEIIIVDDCSNDQTGALPQLNDPAHPMHLIRLPYNCGVSCARNRGVGAAQGAWIAFLDSDDKWLPQKLSAQIGWLAAHPGFRIMQTSEIWIRNGTRVNPPLTHKKKQGDIFKESLLRCMVTPSSVIMEKNLFLETGGFNEAMRACEDYDLWLKIACRCQVGLLDENLLIRYGGHADQLSRATFALDRFRIRSLLDLLRGNYLSDGQRDLAIKMLAEKAAILANGFKKRNNIKESEHYAEIANTYPA